MAPLETVAALGIGAALLISVTFAVARHRRGVEVSVIREPNSLVRVLATPEELVAAADRAAAFEEALTGSLTERVARYRALGAPPTIVRLPAAEATPPPSDDGVRSAS